MSSLNTTETVTPELHKSKQNQILIPLDSVAAIAGEKMSRSIVGQEVLLVDASEDQSNNHMRDLPP